MCSYILYVGGWVYIPVCGKELSEKALEKLPGNLSELFNDRKATYNI